MLPCYRKYVYSLCHYSGLDLILKLYHGGRKQTFICFVLHLKHQYACCFLSSFSLIFIVSLFYKTSGLSPCSTSFTAIVYFFLSLLFCDITSVCHPIQLSMFYFSNKTPGVLNLSQCQLPAF
jgi:hypothetical protein